MKNNNKNYVCLLGSVQFKRKNIAFPVLRTKNAIHRIKKTIQCPFLPMKNPLEACQIAL